MKTTQREGRGRDGGGRARKVAESVMDNSIHFTDNYSWAPGISTQAQWRPVAK